MGGDQEEADGELRVSGVNAVAEIHRATKEQPLERALLDEHLDERIDAMLARHNGGDHLGALVLAESVLIEEPTNVLASAYHRESTARVRGFLSSKPERPRTNSAVDMFGRLILASLDGRRTLASLLPRGSRVMVLRALHDLVRLGVLRDDQG